MTLFGPDISNQNFGGPDSPNLVAVTEFINVLVPQGFSWIEVKCSQGSDFVDPIFQTAYRAAGANALPIVAYHYIDTSCPSGQARNCLAALAGAKVPVMFDFEDGAGEYNNYTACLSAFRAAGMNVALSYIPHWYWEEDHEPDLATTVGLVSSAYPWGGTAYASGIYEAAGGDQGEGWNGYGGAEPVFWQFTDQAEIGAIKVDCNAFRGTPTGLQALLT